MVRERSDEIRYTLIIIDVVLSALAFILAFALRFSVLADSEDPLSRIVLSDYVLLGILLSFSQVVVFSLLGLYRGHRFLSFTDEIGLLIGGMILNIAFSFAILYYLRIYELSRLLPILYGVSLVLIVTVGHSLFRFLLKRLRMRGRGMQGVVIVGVGATAQRTSEILEASPLFGYRVLGFVADSSDAEAKVPSERILGRWDELDVVTSQHHPRDIIYTGLDLQSLETVLAVCDRQGVQLHVIPSFGEVITSKGLLEDLGGLPLISIRDIPARFGINRILKRAFDIVFSGLFMLVFSWLFLLIALAIKLTSRGPVFFSQDRVGLDNKVFKILKFRTMRVQEAQKSDTLWTTQNDPRITSIGQFLRKSSLDEIPQFINIFFGQMSVVGPRPERPYFVEQFKDQYKYFKRRHAVKAGLTGWAQINGLRGDTSIQARIDADIYYIENWTFFLDLKIVFLTPFKGMIHKNAY